MSHPGIDGKEFTILLNKNDFGEGSIVVDNNGVYYQIAKINWWVRILIRLGLRKAVKYQGK